MHQDADFSVRACWDSTQRGERSAARGTRGRGEVRLLRPAPCYHPATRSNATTRSDPIISGNYLYNYCQ